MTDPMQPVAYDDGDIDTNSTANPHLNDIIATRLSRRATLRHGVSAMTAAFFGGALLAGCDEEDNEAVTATASGPNAVTGGRMVMLTGAVTSGTLSNAAWVQTSGPAVALTNANSLNASFRAPAVAAATPLGFRLETTSGDGVTTNTAVTVTVNPIALDFTAVPKSLADVVAVPAGYDVTVLYRLGDPLAAGVSAYANNGTDSNFAQRAGDHHDGMSYFGLAATGTAPSASNSTRGLLVMNHENITESYLHPNGPTGLSAGSVRPTAEVLKEMECHGVSVVEVTRGSAGWSYVQGSSLNRRITPFTPTSFSGPVAGNALLFTAFSPNGTAGRGTINNCANGMMPWMTYCTAEENWAGYFRRDADDNARRSAALGTKSVTAFNRYGLGIRIGNYNWTSAAAPAAGDTRIAKFNATVDASKAANGTGDYRNEPNQYGWIVEIDPFDPNSTPRKRTALGRMNHEGVCPGRMIAGVKPAFYMGDDAQGEYIYKFVSNTAWAAADATAANRLAVGDKYLDAGTLYVARFAADGSGQWLPLVFGQGVLTPTGYPTYAFADQADVLTHCRLAADAVGATRMDRPEWTAVNPATGEMYCTLTNNSSRRPTGANAVDAANPRAYVDTKVTGGSSTGNVNGHVIRLRETNDSTEATGFTWDVYAFGAEAGADAANINLSGLDATNDFSSPDGLWFSEPTNTAGQATPVMWIQTDDGAYTDVTNCMMLAAIPGRVGDGSTKSVTSTVQGASATVQARVGKAPGASLKRFLVGPKGCEITGITSSPDGTSLFVNIQHPGEGGDPQNITSNWPANQTGTAAAGVRPRSATIVIAKADGGIVGI
ncbi:PhoX family protein [Sphingomonas carotinifaciens]|uniref:DUF839 domain-containing protein n=1 Tax=Sphingomonas carotinifaciens TaxID=1166323 RepID=A0A1G7FEK6_9SPHN|nr:PhoX family phosphatase [Sphingomonas carotinifaciens]MBB4086016.1 hypothetical protein [Sphingomonas carotinifaciens]MWC45401.1 DUF839 domain-containing protein [Sphingomonas carotinifaciens]SDE74348.1 hypothetical protein SAMN05216557_101370 [Sphingomonas carotinifaciens]